LEKRNKLILVSFLSVLLTACAGAAAFYGIEWPESGLIDDAVLFVPKDSTAKKDLPMTACKPDETLAGKCVVLLKEEFFNLLRENKELKIRVAELERRCGNP
jgi:hypothetical protein